jgi:hypothetical protein
MRFFTKPLALVFYTNWFVRKWAAGLTIGPIMFIRPRAREDEGLLQHELVHVRQFWRTFGFHLIMYPLSKKYRLKSEVEAYCASLKYPRPDYIDYLQHYPDHFIEYFAEVIATKYRLKITKEEAIELLRKCDD